MSFCLRCATLIVVVFIATFNLFVVEAKPTKLDKPVIKSVEAFGQTAIKIKWNLAKGTKNATRFRIFYNDYRQKDFLEWPAQIIRHKSEFYGSHYKSFSFLRSFDCYNGCIKNPTCVFAVYKTYANRSHPNCFFKSKISNESNKTLDDSAEYVQISEYKNEAILKGISSAQAYTFMLTVYDQELDVWSDQSDSVEYQGSRLEINLKYKKENDQIILQWEKDKNFTVSRYNVLIAEKNKVSELKKIPIVDNIVFLYKYKFTPDYYRLSEDFIDADSERDCFKKCIEKSDCIRYVFMTIEKTCYLLTEIDLPNSHYRSANAMSYNIQNDMTEFKLPGLSVKSTYVVQLEHIDPFGFKEYSEPLIINADENSKSEVAAATTAQSKESEDVDIDDKMSKIDKESNMNNNEFSSEANESGIEESLSISDSSKQIKRVGEKLEIGCIWSGLSRKALKWKKDDDEDKELNVVKQTFEIEVRLDLQIDSVQKSDQGNYTCIAEDDPNTYLKFSLEVTDVPSKPTIENVDLLKDQVNIKWSLDDDGGLDLTSGLIEFSSDFKNNDILVDSYELDETDLKNSQKSIKKLIDSDTYVRIRLENSLGKGKSSDARLIKPISEIKEPVIKVNTESTKSPENGESNKAKSTESENSSNSKLYVILSVIGVIILIMLVAYFVFKKTKSSKNNNESNSGSGNKSSKPLLSDNK